MGNLPIDTFTQIMQVIVGILLASVPAIAWTYIFFQKDKDSRKTLFLSFLGGIVSVIPFLLYMEIWSKPIEILGYQFNNLVIFNFLNDLVLRKDFVSLLEFTALNVIVALGYFLVIMALMMVLRLIFLSSSRTAIQTVVARAMETPFQFIIIGVVVSIFGYFLDFSVNEKIWYFILAGAMEEYAKFLVLRFLDDGNYKGIDDVILQAVMIALGFAFLENIVYFVFKVWLQPCTSMDVSTGVCLVNQATGEYSRQIGVVLPNFIGRSLFSTLGHVIFSSIFGYFYGMAYFRKLSDEEKENEKKTSLLWKFITFSKSAFYYERMIITGLILSMLIHSGFNIMLFFQVNYLIVPFLLGGYLLVDYLIGIKHSLKNQGMLDDDLKVAPTFSGLMKNIEILKEFEDKLKSQVVYLEKKRAEEHLEEKVDALEKFEEQIRHDEHDKTVEEIRKDGGLRINVA